MAIDWDGVLTKAQEQAETEADLQLRAKRRLAKAFVLAFAEAMLESATFFDLYETSVQMQHLCREADNGNEQVLDGRDALLEWAKVVYGADLESLRWDLSEHSEQETLTARERVEKLLNSTTK